MSLELEWRKTDSRIFFVDLGHISIVWFHIKNEGINMRNKGGSRNFMDLVCRKISSTMVSLASAIPRALANSGVATKTPSEILSQFAHTWDTARSSSGKTPFFTITSKSVENLKGGKQEVALLLHVSARRRTRYQTWTTCRRSTDCARFVWIGMAHEHTREKYYGVA